MKKKISWKDRRFFDKWTPSKIRETRNWDVLALRYHCGGIWAIRSPRSNLVRCAGCGEIFKTEELEKFRFSEHARTYFG